MPSVSYMNQSAPFWDFVASLEQEGRNHPFFSQNQNDGGERGEGHQHGPSPPPFGPWGWGSPFWGRDMPHRGPPPSHEQERSVPMGENSNEKSNENMNEKEKAVSEDENDTGNGNGEGPSNQPTSDTEGCSAGRGPRGRCGRGRRGPHGPFGRGGFSFWPGPHHDAHHGHPSHHHGRRGGWGNWGGPRNHAPFNPLAFAAQFFDPSTFSPNNESKPDNSDFVPDADIFDTPSAYIIHVSLPGCKKEDVGVNWDVEKSELSIAGVVYRPGVDEEMLKSLDMSERKVGPFERKIRLGTRASPAHVDEEGISAKLEDGVLRVEVPKLEKGGFVEVRRVDVE